MAAGTGRIRIGAASGAGGGVAFDAAPGKAWTALTAGPLGLVLRVDKGQPAIEFYMGATGSPPVDSSQGLPLAWGESQIIQISLLTGNTIWYRCDTASSFTYMKDA